MLCVSEGGEPEVVELVVQKVELLVVFEGGVADVGIKVLGKVGILIFNSDFTLVVLLVFFLVESSLCAGLVLGYFGLVLLLLAHGALQINYTADQLFKSIVLLRISLELKLFLLNSSNQSLSHSFKKGRNTS